MALTAAERAKRYREKRNNDKERNDAYKAKHKVTGILENPKTVKKGKIMFFKFSKKLNIFEK